MTSRRYPARTGRALEKLCDKNKRLENRSEFDCVQILKKIGNNFFCDLVIKKSDFKEKVFVDFFMLASFKDDDRIIKHENKNIQLII